MRHVYISLTLLNNGFFAYTWVSAEGWLNSNTMAAHNFAAVFDRRF